MKRSSAFYLLTLLFLTSCSSSLSRGQAENLIKKKGSAFLGSPLDYSVPVVYRLENLKETDPDAINSGQKPIDLSPLPKGQYLGIKLTDALAKEGVLRLVSVENRFEEHHEGNYYLGNWWVVYITYAGLPSPDIQLNNNNSYIQKIDIIVARPQLGAATGIVQGERSASVEAEVIYAATPMHQKLMRAARALGSLEPNMVRWSEQTDLNEIDQRVGSKTSKTFSFTKYDDGWRLDPNP